MKGYLVLAAVTGAGTWAALAAVGVPSEACAWVSGAAAAAVGIGAAARTRYSHPAGAAHLQVARTLAGAAAGTVLAVITARSRYWAAYRLLTTADRHAERNGATSLSIRPGRLARPVFTGEVLPDLPGPQERPSVTTAD